MKNPLTVVLFDQAWQPTIFLFVFCFRGKSISAQVKRDKPILIIPTMPLTYLLKPFLKA